jgi:hypothetical protein
MLRPQGGLVEAEYDPRFKCHGRLYRRIVVRKGETDHDVLLLVSEEMFVFVVGEPGRRRGDLYALRMGTGQVRFTSSPHPSHPKGVKLKKTGMRKHELQPMSPRAP